ncbi:hypothetical protein LEM8419_01016 [Neolewinella maritima]|uniref:DUF2911 domain-containing protein n=1 Tax=Neolewinella maritima TaxID=1383882 RepID=A0ABN8F6L8_9BACT|nr:DUF2911 domain-containing protein [Neolewinella maritima]CAH0999716.1 hypothetical protein LEM8419_01016 [Neolewinella maritima]
MTRYLFTGLLFSGLLLTTSCNTPSNGTSTTDNTTEEPDTVMPSGTDDMADNTMGGENYTVTVLDTTIKSPRKQLKGTVDGVDVTINYGSPSVNQRTIYGDLVPYGKVWRTGANEATRITFAQDVKVGTEGTELAAGTYSLFTMPNDKNDWTIIFNKTAEQWGAYDYAEGDDVARVKGTATELPSPAEKMDFALEGSEVTLMWSDLKVSFPVSAAAK